MQYSLGAELPGVSAHCPLDLVFLLPKEIGRARGFSKHNSHPCPASNYSTTSAPEIQRFFSAGGWKEEEYS